MACITKAFIKARFELAAEAMGWDIGPTWVQQDGKTVARVGTVYLDHNPTYGGWDICQIVNEGGAIRQVNGWANRMTNAELVAFMDGLVKGVEHARKG